MKKHLFLAVAAIVLLAAFTIPKTVINANSWNLKLDELSLVSDPELETAGTIEISQKLLSKSEKLSVNRYLCGAQAIGSTSILVVENNRGYVLKKYTNENKGMSYQAEAPASDILGFLEAENGQPIKLYFVLDKDSPMMSGKTLMGEITLISK
jgi:opacity protein-like surface antigen